jgi:ferrous iron transport protein A
MFLNMHKNKEYVFIRSCPANEFLSLMGVKAGIKVLIVTKQPIGGPVVIRIDQRDIAIDSELAKEIITELVTINALP